jgi:hypothetical protein
MARAANACKCFFHKSGPRAWHHAERQNENDGCNHFERRKRFSSNGGEFPYIHMNQNNYAGIGINGKKYKENWKGRKVIVLISAKAHK